ncbi:ABC transporter substrate-binding protein [Planctomycetota bacterium]
MTAKVLSEGVEIEKPELEICFIPIVCAAPLIYAHSHSFFRKNGLSVKLRSAPGWSGIKELLVHDKVDAVHMLSPMPLACSLGVDGKQADIRLAAIQNVNGQALTLARRHLGIEDVRDMRGLTFGVPYRFSMHYYLLCYFLAANGLNPLKDVTIKEVAPPRMPYYLEKGWVDGVFAPEPFNQIPVHRSTGFIFKLSKDIWEGHPCCSFATSRRFTERYPNTYRTMLKSVLEAEHALHLADSEQRRIIAREICDPEHLDQEDPLPVEQVLSGEFPDGRGAQLSVPDRIDFLPQPWVAYGSWMLSQMQRWDQLPVKVDYREVVESVFDTEGAADLATAVGFTPDTRPSLGGVAPFTGEDPHSYMLNQPYSAFQQVAKPLKEFNLQEPVKSHLESIVEQLAEVAGGNLEHHIDVTAKNAIGTLELTLNELILNMKFAWQAVAEQRDRLEDRVRERTASLTREIAERKKAEELVREQSQAILELSTPAIQVWDNILVQPLIGAIDTERARQLVEHLLRAIADRQAEVVIIDITGVPVVDTMVAASLMSTVQAARMLGAECVVTGVNPSIAQTLVRSGVSLGDVKTKGSLQGGLQFAFEVTGQRVTGRNGRE